MTAEQFQGHAAIEPLAVLRRRAPDSGRTAATRSACVAVLNRPRQQTRTRAALVVARQRVLGPALLAAAIAGFFSEVVHRALRLYGF
jgi:hypothetical protein